MPVIISRTFSAVLSLTMASAYFLYPQHCEIQAKRVLSFYALRPAPPTLLPLLQVSASTFASC